MTTIAIPPAGTPPVIAGRAGSATREALPKLPVLAGSIVATMMTIAGTVDVGERDGGRLAPSP